MMNEYNTRMKSAGHCLGNKITRAIIILLVLILLGLVIAVVILAVKSQSDEQHCNVSNCPITSQLRAQFTTSNDLYRDLTKEEILQVRNYIINEPSLNVTPHEKATIDSNYIFLIELENPDKYEAVAFLDADGIKPIRRANVIIFKGAALPPVVEEVLVMFTDPMKHKMNTRLTNKVISFNARPVSGLLNSAKGNLVNDFGNQVHKILNESYDGYTIANCSDRCLTYSESCPVSLHRSGERLIWIWFMRNVPGYALHPVGLEILLQAGGNDVNKWKIEKVYYSKTIFNSIQEFINAYEKGKVTKIFLPAPTAAQRLYSTLERRGDKLQPSQPLRGPRLYEPDGRRYTADSNHIEYMGWSFEFRLRMSSGIQLFDIRFNGERIVYELSLQEAAAFYGGYSPMQSNTDYLDSMWGIGANFELVKGVDCPDTATFFDVVGLVDSSTPKTSRNAICVFEHNTGVPLRRHFQSDFEGGYDFYGGMSGSALILRTICTPYNYDYIYDITFYPNGVINTKVSTSGYLQATLWTLEEENYGSQVHRDIAGSIHDHLLHFKVDLDIAGRKNNFEKVSVKVENISSKWFPGQRRIQKHIKRELQNTEKDAAYKFDFQQPCHLNIYNDKKKNSQGAHRGYRVHFDGILNQLYPEVWNLTNGFHWSFYQMVVTKYKYNEDRSSSIYNQNDLYNPVVDFSKFIEDNESIINEDLVSWISVGLMHIPHSEDIPNTATPGNSAGFFLRPFNYFNEDPSMASRDGVMITPPSGGSKGRDVGRSSRSRCIPREQPINFLGRQV